MANKDNFENKLFMIISSRDRLVLEELSFMYAFNSIKKEWFGQVRVIFWGPAQLLIIEDEPLQDYLKEMQEIGVETWACKRCAEDLGVVKELEYLDIKMEYVGDMLTEMLKKGWRQLTF